MSENAKQRFALREETDPSSGESVLWIRANQGHSVTVEDLELSKIENADEVPIVVHGTFMRHWESIRECRFDVAFVRLKKSITSGETYSCF